MASDFLQLLWAATWDSIRWSFYGSMHCCTLVLLQLVIISNYLPETTLITLPGITVWPSLNHVLDLSIHTLISLFTQTENMMHMGSNSFPIWATWNCNTAILTWCAKQNQFTYVSAKGNVLQCPSMLHVHRAALNWKQAWLKQKTGLGLAEMEQKCSCQWGHKVMEEKGTQGGGRQRHKEHGSWVLDNGARGKRMSGRGNWGGGESTEGGQAGRGGRISGSTLGLAAREAPWAR